MGFTSFSPLLLSPAIVNFKRTHAKSGRNNAKEFEKRLTGLPGGRKIPSNIDKKEV
jgi:hypothetical protein